MQVFIKIILLSTSVTRAPKKITISEERSLVVQLVSVPFSVDSLHKESQKNKREKFFHLWTRPASSRPDTCRAIGTGQATEGRCSQSARAQHILLYKH